MDTMASQITSLTIVYSTIYSGADQRKHQSSASLAFVSGNSPVTGEFPAKGPVTWKMSPFDDVIMKRWLVCQILYIKGRDKTTSHSICYVGCNRFSLPLIAASAHQSWIEAIICTFHGQKAIHIWPLNKAQYIKMHCWKCDVQSYWTLLASIRCRPWSTLDELVRIVILHEAEQMWSLLKYRSTIHSSPWITDNGQDICSHQIRLLHVELLENIQLPSEYIETDEQMVDGWTDWTRSVMKMTLP